MCRGREAVGLEKKERKRKAIQSVAWKKKRAGEIYQNVSGPLPEQHEENQTK
jgi:hypothetical protein